VLSGLVAASNARALCERSSCIASTSARSAASFLFGLFLPRLARRQRYRVPLALLIEIPLRLRNRGRVLSGFPLHRARAQKPGAPSPLITRLIAATSIRFASAEARIAKYLVIAACVATLWLTTTGMVHLPAMFELFGTVGGNVA
jgi:hypothetical protein